MAVLELSLRCAADSVFLEHPTPPEPRSTESFEANSFVHLLVDKSRNLAYRTEVYL